MAKGKIKYSEAQIENLIKGIFEGEIDKRNLPKDLYNAISKTLEEGIDVAFGGEDSSLSDALQLNIRMFSAAKTYQQINDISLLKDGDVKSFSDFKKEALEVYDQYNVTWLETEYSTTVGQALSARNWETIQEQKDVLPYLKYSAVIDENTSDICEPLDGITLPVDDPFWDKFAPLNHFNCRCLLESVDEYDAVVTPQDEVEEKAETVGAEMQDVFKSNPGKREVIFDKDHPYFDVPKDDKKFAKENFGLPLENDE